MNPDLPSLILLALSFTLTFVAARALSRWLKRRNAKRDEEKRRAGESRQVRRARERRGSAR